MDGRHFTHSKYAPFFSRTWRQLWRFIYKFFRLPLLSHYVWNPPRHQLTDFHASNILVDKLWNVTGLIDLEWICALPLEMLDVPYWLTGCAIDQIKGEKLEHFD
ncbi:hypothetical protein HYQ46_004410 [Verticillium longisporum]|nr:hypothetical protein HYQ46_004410 [Verticillium longisporum]